MKKVIVLGIFVTISISAFTALAQSMDGSGGTDSRSHQYFMHLDGTGAPHFNQPFSSNDPLIVKDYWDSLFDKGSGYDSLIDKRLVSAIASDGDDLYLGGGFEYFDGIRCYNIIHYNLTTGIWSTLDSGFNATVEVLKIHNGKLYAGGRFNRVGFNGTTSINYIAVWDGASKKWQEIGGGVNNNVRAIEFMDTSIIVGGDFTTTGGMPVSYIAHWDGHTWDDMNGGVASTVYTLLATGDSLYVGGTFYTRTPGLPSEIALFTGGNWLPLGDGLDGNVYSLAMIKGQLWVGGDFTTTAHDQQELNSLAIWDGNNWNAFGSGADTGLKGKEVLAITPIGDSVYLGGSFYSVAGTLAHGIVKWSNNKFTSLGSGVYGEVSAIGAFNSSLYVGGTFLTAGNISVNSIAKTGTGDSWSLVEPSISVTGGYSETYINAVITTPQYVFIGGSFSTIAKKPFNNIAAWDKINHTWIPIGKGVDREVYCLAIQGSNLYVGGNFNYAGDSIAQHIAYWDFNAKIWHPMGDGAVRYVSSIAANETGVYAAVFFPFLNTGLYNYIGQWNGTQWNQINNTINGYVNAIAAQGPTLYIGGAFTYIDGQKSSHIAEYDGSSWSPLGSGVDNEVRSIAIAGSEVYVAGYFTNAGSLPVNYIARWDGNNWNDLKVGLNNYAYALAWNGSSLYVGGAFTKSLSGTTADFLAKWDGSNWSSVTGGTEYPIYGVAVDNAGLYIGGGFSTVNGGKLNSFRFGILHFGSAGVSGSSDQKTTIQNFPNPFTTETTISYVLAHDGLVNIEIYSLLGLKVKTVVNEFKAAGDYEVIAAMKDIPSGTYFCKFTQGGVTQTKEINLMK